MANASSHHDISRVALWFGLFGGLAAWALHLGIAYVLVYGGCALGLDNTRLWLIVVTVLLGVVTLAAVGMAYRTWRRVKDEQENFSETDFTRIQFMAIVGIWLSGLSFMALLLTAIPILWLRVCG